MSQFSCCKPKLALLNSCKYVAYGHKHAELVPSADNLAIQNVVRSLIVPRHPHCFVHIVNRLDQRMKDCHIHNPMGPETATPVWMAKSKNVRPSGILALVFLFCGAELVREYECYWHLCKPALLFFNYYSNLVLMTFKLPSIA